MNPLRTAASALLCTLALVSQQAAAVEYQLPAANSRLIGENQEYVVPADNRPLEQIASDFQLGLTNIMEANPVSTLPAQGGQQTGHPHQLILPNAPREGIVINVAEMRLYYYPKGKNVVQVLPIGIGQLGVNTPENWITRWSASAPTRPGPRLKTSVAATPPRARPCRQSGRPARTTPWVCTRSTSATCTPFTAPTPPSASVCG